VFIPQPLIWLFVAVLAALGTATALFLRSARLAKGEHLISEKQMQIRTVRLLQSLHEHQRGTSATGQPGDGWNLYQRNIEQALRVPPGTIYAPLETPTGTGETDAPA
jgi:hypothetical protein